MLVFLSICGPGVLSGRAQPELISGPTTANPTLRFLFSEPMSTEDMDITWEGTGVDSAKFSCEWLDEIFGIPIPALTIDCTYAGGLPGGVDVTYTLNKGNSGRMQSAAGEALEETSGTFKTEGGTGNPCTGTNTASAVITLIKEVNYRQTGTSDPVFDTQFKAQMTAGVITSTNPPPVEPTSAKLQKPDGSSIDLVKLTIDLPGFEFPPTFYLSTTPSPDIQPPTFESEAALDAAYPNGTYKMIVGLEGGGSSTVNLPLSANPAGPIPRISNAQALQGFDVSQPLTVSWNAFAGATQNDSIQLDIEETDGSQVFFAPDPCNSIELAVTDTQITIPVGVFSADTSYVLTLTFSKGTHMGEETIAGFQEFAAISRSTRLDIGAPNSGPGTAQVVTAKPAPNGTVMLTIEGTVGSATTPANVQGSTDLETWTTVTQVTKAALEGAGGHLEVLDPTTSTTTTPYKFYRIEFP